MEFMKACVFSFTFILALVSISCTSMPEKEYADATLLRERATKYDLSPYVQAPLTVAEDNYSEAGRLMEEKNDAKKTKEVLAIATTNYTVVIDEGLPPYSEDLKNDIAEEKSLADSIKASVASPKEYEDGDVLFLQGQTLICETKYEAGVEALLLSRAHFNKAYVEAKEKYDQSSDSLEALELDWKEINSIADEIDQYQLSD